MDRLGKFSSVSATRFNIRISRFATVNRNGDKRHEGGDNGSDSGATTALLIAR